ncbi:MAG: hypothetical protein JWO36_7098 [Myxococcales bacterium]|nr:hypothetical protein [Myxococcales bacterium]
MTRFAVAVAIVAAGCGDDLKPTFIPDPPVVYVAKVKNILVGLSPTDAEIASVTADPKALAGLVDGWMAMPEYQQKMMVFFENAFQQTQITQQDFVDMIPPNGLGRGRAVPLLVANVRESFARTVLDLQAEGRPLTDAFTTKRLMMTPALMELYAFLDTRRVDDAGLVTDSFARANPTLRLTIESAQGPIALTDTLDPTSPNYMHWYSPDLPNLMYGDMTCNGLDPISVAPSALFVHTLLYGEIPNHPGPTNNCPPHAGGPGDVHVTGTDFSTWKMVAIRPPLMGEKRTTFYDLPALRSASELVLTTPRPGFFSTPAFFANWPTNQSNQMRVTVNQSLIVATGAAIDGTDSTTPATTPGLDTVHAAPDTGCFSCHQLLDPTRSILASTYSWFYYPQTDQALAAQHGLFAFQNVIAPMQTIDDFANLLASHPLVPQGWAQKLCYYVNSAPCDPSDPELTRIVDDFSKSGLSWNVLVRDLVTSPITTNTAQTVTAQTNGEVIAVSRRDHLCAALNNRLGFLDICQLDITQKTSKVPSVIAQIVSGMPSDGYGRGATIPVLPNDPNLFYRAGLENICEAVATLVIDAPQDPMQPGAKHWASAQPDAAIADFVSTIMALPASDPRAPQAIAILKQHFTSATQTGATPSASLQSTFVAACLSPSFIGIGM